MNKPSCKAVEVNTEDIDIDAMNQLLKSQRDYIEGVEFRHVEMTPEHTLQFYYFHPDGFTSEQVREVEALLHRVKSEWMPSHGQPLSVENKRDEDDQFIFSD